MHFFPAFWMRHCLHVNSCWSFFIFNYWCYCFFSLLKMHIYLLISHYAGTPDVFWGTGFVKMWKTPGPSSGAESLSICRIIQGIRKILWVFQFFSFLESYGHFLKFGVGNLQLLKLVSPWVCAGFVWCSVFLLNLLIYLLWCKLVLEILDPATNLNW